MCGSFRGRVHRRGLVLIVAVSLVALATAPARLDARRARKTGSGGIICEKYLPTLSAGAAPVSVSQVIDQYVRASGGAAAFARLKTQIRKGAFVHGRSAPLEVQQRFPDHWLAITDNLDDGVRKSGCNGKVLWVQEPDGRVQILPASGVALESLLWDSRVAMRLGQIFPGIAPGSGSGDPNDVTLETAGGRHRAVFDSRTGLLRRVDGVHFDDYRVVDGVQVPFRVRLSEGGGKDHLTLQFHEVRHNVSLDDSRFDPPTAPPAAAAR